MREIKFRVWTGTKMEYRVVVGALGAFFVEGLDQKDLACISPFNKIYPSSTPVMEFTGLKDKHGREIYEGDIIVLPKKYPFFTPKDGDKIDLNTNPDIKNGIPNYRATVEWVYSQWQCILHTVNPKVRGISDDMNEGLNDEGLEEGAKSPWKVIGNMYENPELLTTPPEAEAKE